LSLRNIAESPRSFSEQAIKSLEQIGSPLFDGVAADEQPTKEAGPPRADDTPAASPRPSLDAELALELDFHAAGAERQPGALLSAMQAKDHALLVLHDNVVLTLDDGGPDFG